MELSRGYRRRIRVRRHAVTLLAEATDLLARDARGGLDHAEQQESDAGRRAEQHRRLTAREVGGGFQKLIDGLVANLAGEVVDAFGRLAREAGQLGRGGGGFARGGPHGGRYLPAQCLPPCGAGRVRNAAPPPPRRRYVLPGRRSTRLRLVACCSYRSSEASCSRR